MRTVYVCGDEQPHSNYSNAIAKLVKRKNECAIVESRYLTAKQRMRQIEAANEVHVVVSPDPAHMRSSSSDTARAIGYARERGKFITYSNTVTAIYVCGVPERRKAEVDKLELDGCIVCVWSDNEDDAQRANTIDKADYVFVANEYLWNERKGSWTNNIGTARAAIDVAHAEKTGKQVLFAATKPPLSGDCAEPKRVAVDGAETVNRFHDDIIAACRDLGPFLVEKNKAYGDAATRVVACLEQLFPAGIPREHYANAYFMIQVLNKLSRIASQRGADPMGEDPWHDAAGYSTLAHAKQRSRP